MAATKKIFDPKSITGFINAISVPDTVFQAQHKYLLKEKGNQLRVWIYGHSAVNRICLLKKTHGRR